MAQADSGFRGYVGLEVVSAGDGCAEVRLQADERHLNPHGSVHGGAMAALADAAMGTAVSTLTDGRPVTIEMKITFLEPGRPGLLRARATTRKPGRRITIVEAEISQATEPGSDASDGQDSDEPASDDANAEDEVVAHAIATFTTLD